MDLVTLMTLKLTARQVGTDRLVTAIMKSVEPVGESRRAGMSATTALPRPQKYQLTGMAGCIIPNHHRRRKVAMTSMSGSGNISPMSPEQSTPIARKAMF